MPRRVYTYQPGLGWDIWNLLSTIGAYVVAIGVALILLDDPAPAREGQGERQPLDAGTLEWLPMASYSTRSIPHITSREPLWISRA